jgi:hypothetical protein
LPRSLSSSSRRVLILGALLAVGATAFSVTQRRDEPAAAAGGDVASCVQLTGDAARACYRREVGAELSAIGASAPRAVFAADTSGEVTFAADDSAALLCDLHLRVGVTDESKPSWTGWAEPLS